MNELELLSVIAIALMARGFFLVFTSNPMLALLVLVVLPPVFLVWILWRGIFG